MNNNLFAAGKRPYVAPAMLERHITSTKMLAASGDPVVHTTSSKASTDYDVLVKEDKSYNVWNDDWSQ